MGLGNNIKQLRRERDWTLEELSRRSDVDTGTIHALEARDSKRSMYAAAIAKGFGISLESLLNHEQRVATRSLATTTEGSHDPTAPHVAEDLSHYAHGARPPAHGSESAVLTVPLLANAGSMGFGNELLNDDVLLGGLPLNPLWVTERLRPTSPMHLRFLHAYGDSMSPTFESGDILLVDTGQRDPAAIDGVYAMSANDRLYIKRVRQTLAGQVEVSSDNPNVKTVDALNGDQQVTIHGRVIWVWNGRRL